MSDHDQGPPSYQGDDESHEQDIGLTRAGEGDDGVPQSGARVISSLIDGVVATVLLAVLDLGLLAVIVHPAAGAKLTDDQQRTAYWIQWAASAAVALLFAAVQTWGSRLTIGKRLMHFRLTDMAGNPASFGRLIVKYGSMFFLLILPFGWLVVVVGVVAAPLQKQRRTIFDQLSGLRPDTRPERSTVDATDGPAAD